MFSSHRQVYSAQVYEIPPQKLFIWSLLYYLPVFCLIPVQLPPRPSRSMHFRDVSKVPETYRQPRSQVLSLASRKNLIAAGRVAPKIWEPKIRGGEVEEIMVAMTKVTPSGPERSLPPLY